MRLSRKQQIALNNKNFCEQYLMPDWDGCAANDYFANRYDGHIEDKYRFKPKTEFHNSLKEIELAQSKLNGALAPLAFTKDKIMSFLTLLKPENVFVPESIKEREEYISNYLSMAAKVLENINNESYDFQKSRPS